MTRSCPAVVLILAHFIASPCAILGQQPDGDGAALPNFVVVLVDDLGWTDLACYGSQFYQTPNIDGLASRGMRFTEAYAASAVCSPTRAALLTGRYPARHGITDWIRAGFQGAEIPQDGANPSGYDNGKRRLRTPQNHLWMESDELTIAEVLRDAGYATGHIGKWHLGAKPWYPDKQGFALNIGGCDYGRPPGYFFPYVSKQQAAMPALAEGTEGEYLTDREAAEAVDFIRKHKDKPFFLVLAHYAVHTPVEAKPELISKFEQTDKAGQKSVAYAAMIASVDEAFGRIAATLAQLKLSDRTVVLFTSDNGGVTANTNNAPLRAGQGTPYEGGIRVPLIVHWPGVIKGGSISSVPVSSIDVFPTILEIADVPQPDSLTIDGESLAGVLDGDAALDREALYWHFPHYGGGDVSPYGIVRNASHKLIKYYEDGRVELYDLKNDLGEQKDLSAELPDRAKQLDVMLSKWLIGVGAKMPKPNPDFASQPKPPNP